jgi:hypothetical protein
LKYIKLEYIKSSKHESPSPGSSWDLIILNDDSIIIIDEEFIGYYESEEEYSNGNVKMITERKGGYKC